MKKMIFSLLLIPIFSHAQEVPEATFNRLQKLYPDQSLEFIQERIKNAPSAFNKWRSFPPYYYEMIKRSVNDSKFNARPGLCAGDAHLENFGFIANGKTPIFTINDMDDITSCSLNADLMRLFIAQRLIHKELKAEAFLTHYQNGLKGLECPQPTFIKKLSEDSIKKGRGISKKNKAMLDAKTCTGDFSDLGEEERLMLEAFVKGENVITCSQSNILNPELKKLAQGVVNVELPQILHACSRSKTSGGSAGGKRFLIFRKSDSGVIDAFELKQLAKPAPDFDLTITNEVREQKYKEAVRTYLGPEMNQHYYPVTLNNILYQRRPVWAGDESVKEVDIENFELFSQKDLVMLYETCKLGALHSKSNSEPFDISPAEWEKTSQSIEGQFRSEFGQE